jgi:prolyl oligopeptidase
MAVAPANTVKDYENEVARLRALPKWVDQTIAAANLAIAQERVQPRLVGEREVDQLNVEMEPDPLKSPLLAAFTRFPASIPATDRDRLRAEAIDAYTQAFLSAWRKLRDYVSATYIPAARDTVGLAQAPGGPEMYAFLVRQMTTTNYTPEQIHEIGLKEVARIQSEMAKIRQQLNFTGTAEEFSDQVLNAPRFRFHSEAEILEHDRDIAKRIDPELPRLFKVLPRITYGVAPVPPDRARTSSEYYEPPALDGSRAGYLYMRTVDPEKQSSCCSESTILHEAVPGHHLQIALSYEIPGLPDFRKISEFTAYTEGWALYAETLGPDLHMYETPYEMYGFLQGQILRAARLVVDTGIHTMGWSRQQAIDYMVSVGADASRDFIASEVDRYIAWPGQALAYKVGQLKILELRALAQKELGPKFDIREFHDVVLRNGTIPLDILEEQVRDWIAQSKKP